MQSRLLHGFLLIAYGAPQTTTRYKPQAISLYFPTSGAIAISILVVKHSLNFREGLNEAKDRGVAGLAPHWG